MRYRQIWLALLLSFGFTSTPSWAQQLTPEQQKIQELEQKIEDLDRRLMLAEGKTEGASLPQLCTERLAASHQRGRCRRYHSGA